MSKAALFLSFIIFPFISASQSPEANYLSNKTVTYDEAISFYTQLDLNYKEAKMLVYGKTDIGKPLHLFIISSDGDFDPQSIKKKKKCVLLINNGIHPGEPDGIDASMNFAKEILVNPVHKKLLDHMVICIIPVYNIDGALNRGCCSRANQNGPEEYGFRGNARNLDLNRDFIKCDAENTKSFIKIFRSWDPDVFLDTHVSDGADYQYVMTLIPTQPDKLEPVLADYMNREMNPFLFNKMKAEKYEMCPYVNTLKETPDDGITGFLETPRFATGYAALFNTISFVSETHMLKPFPDRVRSTYSLIETICSFIENNSDQIIAKRNEAKKNCRTKDNFYLGWKLDTTTHQTILFKGYEAGYVKSKISNQTRLYYDRSKPFNKEILFYNHYTGENEVARPAYYIIPQAWNTIIEKLQLNKITMYQLPEDSLIRVQCYYIDDYKSPQKPYEGHFIHSQLKLHEEEQMILFRKGDYLIETNHEENRFIVETLEPKGTDSYFTWGFFDGILQQKEWFSDYVFEEKAEEIISKNPSLKKLLEEKQKSDSTFAKDGFAQLYFIYKNSDYFEKSVNRYPVYRINRK